MSDEKVWPLGFPDSKPSGPVVPLQLAVANQSEKERAAEITGTVGQLIRPVLDLMDQAAREGFKVQWQIGLDMYGRHQLVDLHLIKRF